ncbi:L-lactate permease [Arthrobacter sp. H14-L1]|uniref:L-lactate permease n=1 Tax=Arthrobacter sp. H14-L1 TaxID=2996697 RepID=UPI00226EF411|nr:L-lactate permease [Arthrobacter sp. H14-L1]MCY0905952.1 L-lactate permease [Arthrobacter sp. H14-L1]
MTSFQQILAPLGGSLLVSALCAAVPLIILFVLLGVFRVKAAKAALASLLSSILMAILIWQMPVGQALSATAAGAVYGVFPILWILINALWIYKLTVATRWFEALGNTIRSISNDQRIVTILIAFCFGALLEALAGFGAPVAVSAAMLMATGMKPLKAAMVSLLANTAPVAFGAMASPLIALNGVTGLPLRDLSSMVGRQTPFLAVLVPLMLVFIVDGRRGVKQTWPVALVAGAVFGLFQFLTSNFLAVELTDVVASVAAIGAVLLMLRFWQPSQILTSSGETDAGHVGGASVISAAASGRPSAGHGNMARGPAAASVTESVSASAVINPLSVTHKRPTARSVWMAVAPYLVIVVIFSISQLPAVKTWLGHVGTVTFRWPGLDVVDAVGKPVANETFHLDHLKATGTLLLFAGLVTTAIYRIPFRQAVRIYGETLVQLRWTIVTVSSVLALSFVMTLSGETATLGVALASAGGFFTLLSPLIGWLGVTLTGSDTSSNSLFGPLQIAAAKQIGLSPLLMAAANSSGGVLGKMLSPQNLAVAAAAIGMEGSEGTLLRKLAGWSVVLLLLITVLVFLQSTPILGWMVP